MRERTAEIVRRLGERAEEACRHYLSRGRKVGNYWIVGDRHNAKGRSLYVRLHGPSAGFGAAGKWTDAATGEHGDLLDIIATAIRPERHEDALAEAERFLGAAHRPTQALHAPGGDSSTAARLFAAAKAIAGTPAATYLRARGIETRAAANALRFHPRCYYRPMSTCERRELPAMLAAVTDNAGRITGLMRTYLRIDGSPEPSVHSRRALGSLYGNGVRFGPQAEIMAVGEGIETMLSLRMAMPRLSVIAALSAAHLAAFIPPVQRRRLYIAVDRDAAGRNAAARLQDRLQSLSVETIQLTPRRKDFNDDLIAEGVEMLRAQLADQLAADDREAFLGGT